MSQRLIEVEIGELVLHGFPAGDRLAIAGAFQSALAEALGGLLGSDGPPPSLARAGAARVFDGGGFQVARGASSGSIAKRAAVSLAHGLGAGGWR